MFEIPWISVEEKLPPEEERVLVSLLDEYGNRRVAIGQLYNDIWEDPLLTPFAAENEAVTHWHWKPDPAQEEDEGVPS